MKTENLGDVVHSYFVDYLSVQKGLQPTSIRSYRDAIKLFLCFVARQVRRKITRLTVRDLTFRQAQQFLKYLEQDRGNHIRTRNQRLAVLHSFFEYVGQRMPEMLLICEQVARIPTKRSPLPETHYLGRDEINRLLGCCRPNGRTALRDRALLLFLYNTGARVQEAADLRVGNLDLESSPRVRIHGKGDKWRNCPLWAETSRVLKLLLETRREPLEPQSPVFVSSSGRALTRFGIYKLVRRHAERVEVKSAGSSEAHVSPHVLRHTTAVHLVESGTEVNVIRGWLGHVKLETTNRYAEISLKVKEQALKACEPPVDESLRNAVWRNDEQLLEWLDSL